MSNLFYYKVQYKETTKVKDEAGKDVDKEILHERWDFFNVDCVIRGNWTNPEIFTILLNDGHEQSVDKEVPTLNPKGQKIGSTTKRERDWYYSQVNLTKADAERFKLLTEMLYGTVDPN